jgi:hypothetical protein
MSILQLLIHIVAGKLLCDYLIRTRKLEDTVPSLERRGDKEAFLSLSNKCSHGCLRSGRRLPFTEVYLSTYRP